MKTLFFLILFPALAHAGPYYELVDNTVVGTATMTISGYIGVAASSTTPTTYKFRIDGPGGYIQFPDGTQQVTAGGGGGASTIAVNASQFSGNGGTATPLNLVTSSVTLHGMGVSAATANKLVLRDATGSFAMQTATGTLSGNATTASAFDHTPSACGTGQYASAQSAAGVLTCSTPSGVGDNLGNHTATTTLTTAYQINSSSSAAITGTLRVGTAGDPTGSRLSAWSTTTNEVAVYGVAQGSNLAYGLRGSASGANWNYGVMGSANLGTQNAAFATSASNPAAGANNYAFYSLSEAQSVFTGQVNVSSNVVVVGSVTANKYYGDGSALTGIPTAAQLTSTASALTAEISNRTNADLLLIPSSATGTYPLSISGSAATVPQAGVNLSTVTANHVLKSGDTMTGQLTNTSSITITGNDGLLFGNSTPISWKSSSGNPLSTLFLDANNILQIGGASTNFGSPVKLSYDLTTTSSITITGNGGQFGLSVSSNVYIMGYSSANAYYGSGSNLTGIATTAQLTSTASAVTALENNRVLRAGDTMTGPLTVSGSSLTVNGAMNVKKIYIDHAYSNPDNDRQDLVIDHNADFGDFIRLISNDYLAGTFTSNIGGGGTKAKMTLYNSATGTNIVVDPDSGVTTSSNVIAGAYYGNGSTLAGVVQSTATGNYLFRVATATYLATAPGACGAGQYISGLTADGTKTCGTPAGGGDVLLASTQTFTGQNTFSNVNGGLPNFTGMVAFFANGVGVCPEGWILANGTDISTITFSALFTIMGYSFGGSGVNFTKPNMTTDGSFLRSTGGAAAAFGTKQTSANLSHAHNERDHTDRPLYTNTGGSNITFTGVATGGTTLLNTDVSGGSESRPINYAMTPCIKY